MTSIKRHGGWKSTSVAEGYIEDSLNNKIDISNKISNCQPSTSQENSGKEIFEYQFYTSEETKNVSEKITGNEASLKFSSGINVGNNCSNCTVNFYFNNK